MGDTHPPRVRTLQRTARPISRATSLVGAVSVFWLASSLFLQSWRYGLLVTVSFALHELGHILVLAHYRIPWEVRLSLAGVATVTPRGARQRLSHFANSQVHLAGPALSLAQALFALAGYFLSGAGVDDRRESWLLVANLASLLVLLNLLPLGGVSDGGKFIRRLFACLSEREEENVVWSLFLWLLSVVWLLVVTWGDVVRTLGTLAVAVWFVVATLIGRQRDDPLDACEAHSMTRAQGIILFSIVATALLWATGMSALTPFWLTQEHLEKMAYNIAVIIVLGRRAGPLAVGLCFGILVVLALTIRTMTRHRRRA